MPRELNHRVYDLSTDYEICSSKQGTEMATGESVPLLSTAPEKTLLRKDFWPAVTNNESKVKHAEFEDFDAIVKKASDWLEGHEEYELLSCETVQQRCHSTDTLDSDLVLLKKDPDSVCHFVKGLRLWLAKHSAPQERCYSQIDFMDVFPRETQGTEGTEPESLETLLKNTNKHNPIPGTVICIDTVRIDVARCDWTTAKDTKCCKWEDQQVKDRLYFIRVFYCPGQPMQEHIGIADFVPNELRPSSKLDRNKPLYEPFTKLADRAKQWIRCAPGCRVTNLQTVETCHWDRQRLNTQVLLTENVESSPRVFFLRVYYVRPMGEGATVKSPLVNVTCKTFQPAILQISKWTSTILECETLTQTTERAAIYIKEAGVKIFCVETVTVPENLVKKQTNSMLYTEDVSRYTGEWGYQGKTGYTQLSLVQLTRVYLQGWSGEPDSINLPRLPNVIEVGGCC